MSEVRRVMDKLEAEGNYKLSVDLFYYFSDNLYIKQQKGIK